MQAKTYVDNYCLLKDDTIKCNYVEFMIYTAFTNKFIYEINQDEYEIFNFYYLKIAQFVENLREQNIEFIEQILIYIKNNTLHMVDIILMQWCLPNIALLSKKNYSEDYKNKINLYNCKLNMLDKTIIDDSCKRMLNVNKSVPIHCIDFLWNYIVELEIDFVFINRQSANYVSLVNENDNSLTLWINIEYLDYLGLGLVKNKNNKTFKEFINFIINNKELYNYFKTSKSGKNFEHQCKLINNM